MCVICPTFGGTWSYIHSLFPVLKVGNMLFQVNFPLCKLYNQASCFVSVMIINSEQSANYAIVNIITAVMMIWGTVMVSNMPVENIIS